MMNHRHLLPSAMLSVLLAVSGIPAFTMDAPWRTVFSPLRSEAGDTLSVAAVFCDSLTVSMYDLATGSVVFFDSTGARRSTVRLQGIGRTTYAGDDFVVRDTQIIFLNTVDRRLEIFSTRTGNRLERIAVPRNLLAFEPSRLRRFVNRIFLSGTTVMLGNEYAAVPLERGLAKALKGQVLRPPANQRIITFDGGTPVTMQTAGRLLKVCAVCRPQPSVFPISGKRYFILGGRLHELGVGRTGVSVRPVP